VEGSKVTVKVPVSNTGAAYAGKEVVQVYVSAPSMTMDKEYQSLAAFAKTKEIGPGQSEIMEVSFDLSRMASYRESDSSYLLEAGKYIVRVGNSSRNTKAAAVLLLEDKVVVSKHEAVCPQVKTVDELKGKACLATAEDLEAEMIVVDAKAFSTKKFSYETPAICDDEKVKEFLDSFTREEMVELVVGIGMFGGYTRFTMPGSVGNTTSSFWDRGLVNVTLCDGPAGIRIQKRTAVLKNGTTKPVDPVFSFLNALPGFIKKRMMANPNKEKLIYQYTTAFPVACALAQTWNTELLRKVGKAIHDEMKEYGCTYWLAPAKNIHRNPLGGRNFEYFS
jgi:beta-glucosidase